MENPIYINRNLIISDTFRDFLYISCRVNSMILSFETLPEINYLMPGDKLDTISFLPMKRIEYVIENNLDPFDDKCGRVHIKVGRIISKLFSKSLIDEYISDSDIEDFVNNYKSFFDQSNKRLDIVEGEMIRKYYLDGNYGYPEQGTLWKSCMRYYDRQKFLDIYVKNPDKVKMLVLLNNNNDKELVIGRALLWDSVEDFSGNKMKIMDRIYTIYDSDILVFKRWAKNNGYIPKAYQNAKSQNLFEVDDRQVSIDLKLVLSNHKLSYYPYLDSFQFYDESKGFFYNTYKKKHDHVLIQSNGSIYPPDPEPEDDFDDYIPEEEW